MKIPHLLPEFFDMMDDDILRVFVDKFRKVQQAERTRIVLVSDSCVWLMWMAWLLRASRTTQLEYRAVLIDFGSEGKEKESEINLLRSEGWPPGGSNVYLEYKESLDDDWLAPTMGPGSTVVFFIRHEMNTPFEGERLPRRQLDGLHRPILHILLCTPLYFAEEFMPEPFPDDLDKETPVHLSQGDFTLQQVVAYQLGFEVMGYSRKHFDVPLLTATHEITSGPHRRLRVVGLIRVGPKTKGNWTIPKMKGVVPTKYHNLRDARVLDPFSGIAERWSDEFMADTLLPPFRRTVVAEETVRLPLRSFRGIKK